MVDKIQIKTFPVGSIRLTDEYCVNALQKEVEYLLSLQEGRLLAGFYENAGISTPFVRYGGWENALIGGHTLGHYLTAIAQAYRNAGVSDELKKRLYQRVEHIVSALEECQQRSRGKEGFLWGAVNPVSDNAEIQFDNVEAGKLNIIKESWVPWYTMHKLIAGLCDVYILTGLNNAKRVASRLGDWVFRRVSKWNKRLQRKVLSDEYGGMNDCLYILYGITGKKEHLQAAHMFDEEDLFDAILSEKENVLDGKHVNTTIPKIIGALNRYFTLTVSGERDAEPERYFRVAEKFWKMVIERHTYVTGGNSEWEHFGKDYVLDRERTNCNCETCNVYNMLKLTRMLFCATGDKKYTDYYDNAFTNSILSSQNPQTGMTTYFQPMAGGFFKVFSEPYNKFWCCTGSGMESFTKLGDSAYYCDNAGVYVEQYLSSVLETERIKIIAECRFPFETRAQFFVERAEYPFTIRFRIPDWCAGKMRVSLNGIVCGEEVSGHISLTVHSGDKIEIEIPVSVTLSKLPDGDAYAFRYGGTVLSADLGEEDMQTSVTGVDVTVPMRKIMQTESVYFPALSEVLSHPERFLVKEGERFCLVGGDVSFNFIPHYKRFKERYAIYLRLREGEREAEEAERVAFDTVQAGYGQYENDSLHQLEEEKSVACTSDGTYRYAKAGGYFCYGMAVDLDKDNILSVELSEKDNGKPLKITIGGEVVFSEILLYVMGEEFYKKEIPINREILTRTCRKKRADGREYCVISVRFEGNRRSVSAKIYNFIRIYCR